MDITQVLDWFPWHKHPERSSGVHVSDVLDFIEVMVFGKREFTENESNAYWAEMGFIWETYIKRNLLKADTNPDFFEGELTLDGITGSPDGVDLSTGIVHEMKLTWRSKAKSHPKDRQRWMWQVKAYCKLARLNKVMFYVMYVNGDYKPMRPKPDSYLFIFSDEEIEANWNMLLTNARKGGFINV